MDQSTQEPTGPRETPEEAAHRTPNGIRAWMRRNVHLYFDHAYGEVNCARLVAAWDLIWGPSTAGQLFTRSFRSPDHVAWAIAHEVVAEYERGRALEASDRSPS